MLKARIKPHGGIHPDSHKELTNQQEIRTLLAWRDQPDADCGAVNALLDEHIGHVAQRIVELQELERQLRELRQRCPDNRQVQHCGILKELSQSVANEKMPTNHVAGVHVGTSHRTSQ